MKALKKNDMGVSPVIAVILMVAITVVLAGVVFLWAQSFTDDSGGTVETMNVKGTIDDSAETLSLEVISGTYTWGDYKVLVNGTDELTTATASSSAGETVSFTEAGYTFDVGYSYNIKIINIADNKVVWENNIIAKA